MNTIFVLLGAFLALTMVSFNFQRPARLPQEKAQTSPIEKIDTAVLNDLARCCLETGVSIPRSITALAQALGSVHQDSPKHPDYEIAKSLEKTSRALLLGASWEEAWTPENSRLTELQNALEPAWTSGSSPGAILERSAANIRASRSRKAREDAQKLGVKLVLPLGLCFLPAFILLGIVPVVIGAVNALTG